MKSPPAKSPPGLTLQLQIDLPALLAVDNRETYDSKDAASVFTESSKTV